MARNCSFLIWSPISVRKRIMAGTWFGEIPFCCSLTVRPAPAWALLSSFFANKVVHICIAWLNQQNRMFWGWNFYSTGIIWSLIDIDSISCVYIKQTRGQFSWTLQLLTKNWHHISDKKAFHYVIFYCVLMRWWVWWQIYVHTCHFILRIYKQPFADLTASVQFLVPELKTEVTEQLSRKRWGSEPVWASSSFWR